MAPATLTAEQREHRGALARRARHRAHERLAALVRRAAADHVATEDVYVRLSEQSTGLLRSAIHEYASLLRQLEAPFEKANVAVKAVVAEVLGAHGHTAQALTSEAVAWTIHAYYCG